VNATDAAAVAAAVVLPRPPAEPAIAAVELVKSYPGGVRALDGLSFAVPTGSVFGLLGPNGAGKSTAVKILTTLSRPDSGRAKVVGLDVLREPERVRRTIGVVAQRSSVDPQATGRENLTLQGQVYGLRGAELGRRVAELLDRYELLAAADRLAKTYSGGMQRKLDVAMGLVHRPRVLVLDEPTTGLDPEARTEMWEEIARLARQEGVTILLTTHYLEEADHLAERVAIVDRGRVMVEGNPEDLKGELHGDAIHVELGDPGDEARARRALAGLPEIRDFGVDGRLLHARVGRGATAVPAVLTALEAEGVAVASVTVARPSLDDVYLRYAGRAFAVTEREVIR
jgi:ABC-2 type transport system ATP-binding protein